MISEISHGIISSTNSYYLWKEYKTNRYNKLVSKKNGDIKFSLDDLIANDDEEKTKLNIQEIEILSNLVINNIKNISETKKYFITQNGIETADNEIKLLQELNSKLCLMMEK